MTSEVLAAPADAGVGRRASLKTGLVQAGPLAAAGIAANAGSVLVTVVLARLLATPGYGALNQLTGLFFVVSTPGSAVLVAVVRRMTSGTAAGGDARTWAGAVRRRALLALAGFTAAALAAGPFLAPALGRHDQVGVDAIVVAGGVWIFLCVDRGILQAHRAYRTLAGNLLTEGAARTVLMVVAGAAGLGVPGVAVAVLVAELVAVAQARRMADRTWPAGPTLPGPRGLAAGDEPRNGEGWGLAGRWAGSGARDLAGAVVALAAIAVLQNVDVIVMGREGPKQAGAYAAISVSSKTIVFVAVVVAGYVLPEAAIRWRAGGHALRQLWVALALLGAPAAALLAVAIAAPRWFLTVFFSARYGSAADAFLPLALAMTFLSALVVLTMYLLAVGDRWVIALVVLGAAAAAWATAAAHGVPRSTALAELSVEGALVLVASAEMLRVHRRRTS
jgi:O-antigen/teichoic acid export membrane protein